MSKAALVLLIPVMLLFSGCTATVKAAPDNSYPAVVAWNYMIYGLSVEAVPEDSIGSKIGCIERSINSMPSENGDSNAAEAGSPLYIIKGISMQDAIAVGIDGMYYKAYKNRTLQ